LVLPLTLVEPVPSKLCTLIQECFPDLELVPLHRKYFNDHDGIPSPRVRLRRVDTSAYPCQKIGFGFLQHYAMNQNDLPLLLNELQSKYFAITALAAILTYAESAQVLFKTPRSLQFSYKTIDGVMMMGELNYS
jgi:hypothetical protein